MRVSLVGIVVSGVLWSVGVYLLLFPNDCRKRLLEGPNRRLRFLGYLAILGGALVLANDMRAEALLGVVRQIERISKADSNDLDPNRADGAKRYDAEPKLRVE